TISTSLHPRSVALVRETSRHLALSWAEKLRRALLSTVTGSMFILRTIHKSPTSAEPFQLASPFRREALRPLCRHRCRYRHKGHRNPGLRFGYPYGLRDRGDSELA